jgi:hypothetical protein
VFEPASRVDEPSRQLGRAAPVEPLAIAIAVVSLAAPVWFRVSSTWLIVAGGIAGWIALAYH